MSASVAGLPSVSAFTMAVSGRQKCHRSLSWKHEMAASAPVRYSIAKNRAFLITERPSDIESCRKTRFHIAVAWSAQNLAIAVWSGVRVVLVALPSDLT